VVRIGVDPPVTTVGVAERQDVEYELADDFGRFQPGQAARDAVEHGDAADLVGHHHSIRQLVGEDQAPDRHRAFR
jgi:hypothetical protein